jgi:hypothetical protein
MWGQVSLAQIRAEVGQDQPIQHVHAVHVGVNIPPRAATYEEWQDQNKLVGRVSPGSSVRVTYHTPFTPLPACVRDHWDGTGL